ncbi:MAG: aminopeptidase P family N-terminal domain-containing protein, partial [Anaerolineae bacterium]|nr:aminopeptidase P family N-terminal domain-containing protein [Anaerolineae bacterium]
MLTVEGCRSRQERMWSRLRGDVDVAIITTPWHIYYLANCYVSPNTLNSPSSSFLVMMRDGGALLFADNWVARSAGDACVDGMLTYTWYDGRHPGRDRHAGVAREVTEWLRQARPRRVAVEPHHLPWSVGEALREIGVEMVDVTPVLRSMRLRKDPDELALIRRAVQAAVAGHAAAWAAVQPDVSELDVYAAVHAAAVKAAGGVLTMLGDFASGGRSGGPPTDRILQPG